MIHNLYSFLFYILEMAFLEERYIFQAFVSLSILAKPVKQLTSAPIMLGKQWKEEEEAKAQYKAQADYLKKKDVEDYHDYQYTPHKPSEKKRRAPARQYKHVNVNGLVESVASATSVSFNVSISVMSTALQLGNLGLPGNIHEVNGMKLVLESNAMMYEQFNFKADAFNALVQQVNNNGDLYVMYQELSNDGAAEHQASAGVD